VNRQQAVALIMYLQRCVSIIPTTGNEWDSIRSALSVIESVANGQMELVTKDAATKE